MSQVSIYLPDELERRLRETAEQEKLSLSAYVASIIRRSVQPERWPESFLASLGSWEGPLERPNDPPPEARDEL